MTFKKISLERDNFVEESMSMLQSLLGKLGGSQVLPTEDLFELSQSNNRRYKRKREHMILDFANMLVLCNNVTPVIESNGQRVLQASSPDEIALVEFIEKLGIRIINRNQREIEIEMMDGSHLSYDILANFPFSSETKRMGIILRQKRTGRIVFYLKGADSVMATKVPSLKGDFLLEECDMMAKEGLRTLAFSQKYLSEEYYREWRRIYDDACADMTDREERERQAVEYLEQDMEFVGCTGVEDKLQNRVRETVESLKKAGIKIWMLTGDKIETAKCIALSTGIKSINQEFYELKEIHDELDAKQKLEGFRRQDISEIVLIVDGNTLKTFWKSQILIENFIRIASEAPAVICCRCSPTQKADITKAIKDIIKKTTCGVGDGGNDVGMIQMADVGFGVEGKEGKQAALASDFSVREFKNIYKLILWHGRLCYLRTSLLANFVVHRGMIISVIQFIFEGLYYWVSISVFNSTLILGYSTIYTMFPVFSLEREQIFTEDVKKDQCLAYPELYRPLQLGRLLSLKQFLVWTWKSIYQGFIIMFLTVELFNQSFTELASVTFSALIVMELLNVVSTVKRCHLVIVICEIGTLIVYVISLAFLGSVIETSRFTPVFTGKVLVITLVAWVPFVLMEFVYHKFYPSMLDKLKGEAKSKEKSKSNNRNSAGLLGGENEFDSRSSHSGSDADQNYARRIMSKETQRSNKLL